MAASFPASGRGFGKLILFGEHAVVHGVPAIAAGLSLGAQAHAALAQSHSTLTVFDARANEVHACVPADANGAPLEQAFAAILGVVSPTAPVDVHVRIEVPVGAGMGSSASMAVAIASALTGADETMIEAAVAASEGVFHGNPSGIDQTAARIGGVFRFVRGVPPSILRLPMPAVDLVVVVAGPPASTARMVRGVADRRMRQPDVVQRIFDAIDAIVVQATDALLTQDWGRVGELMDINHGLLTALGVSTLGLDGACDAARSAGALGAKLTGAGGGGCVVALAPDNAPVVCDALLSQGFDAFVVQIGDLP